MISPTQRPLPDNTQHSQQKNIHVPGGIRTHDRSRQAALDLRLRPRGYWDRQLQNLWDHNLKFYVKVIVNCRDLSICKGTAMVRFRIIHSCCLEKLKNNEKTQSELTPIRPRYEPKTFVLWHLIKHGGNFT